jgi:hypothetical protein
MKMTETKELLKALIDTARSTKEKSDGFAPMVVYSPRAKGTPGAMGVLADDGPIADQLYNALRQLYPAFGAAEWIAVTSDTWGMHKDASEVVGKDYKHGDLEKEFNAGNPKVVEMMLVMLANDEGISVASQNYRWTPADGWEWDEPNYMMDDEEFGGEVARILKAFFLAQKLTRKIFGKDKND